MKKSIFILLLTLLTTPSFAKCISDIYSVGVSVDSFIFASKRATGKVEVASDYGLGTKLGKVIFCQLQNIEYNPYIRTRYFQLGEARKKPNLGGIDEDKWLMSTGLDLRWIKGRRFEWLMDLEFREEFVLLESNGELKNEDYINLKLALGLRYTVFRSSKADYNFVFKYGGFKPLTETENVKGGDVMEIDLEYFKRMAKDYSIRADIYISTYNQKVDDFEASRLEAGARFNYIFRY